MNIINKGLFCVKLLKKINNKYIVNNISLCLNQGKIVGLLGPNGSGKTTIFSMIIGLIRPDDGNIFLNNENITRYPMYKRAQKGIGYLPQESSIFRNLSVEENIACVLEMTNLTGYEQKRIKEKIIEEFKLKNIRKKCANILSGGERRRTEIARCLAINPNFILLDEPFSGIDPISVEDIQNIIFALKSKGIGILITDHNIQEILSITDSIYFLFEGKIIKNGTVDDLLKDNIIRKIYFGNKFFFRKK